MIESEIELKQKVSEIISSIPDTSLALFRGENQNYPQMRSGKARPNAFIIPEIENGWNVIVGRLIKDQSKSTEYRQSILQHYGYPTFYLDLTSDPLIAAWFAIHEFSRLDPMRWVGGMCFRVLDMSTYVQIKEGIGYFHILEIPNYQSFFEDNQLFDITDENLFIRPQKQSAYLILDKPNTSVNPNDHKIYTLEIDRTIFDSSYDVMDLFPHPNDDLGYNKLLDVPFIQKPFSFEQMGKIENEMGCVAFDYTNNYAKRIIDIPFYMKELKNLFDIKPKTKDLLLFEQRLFRQWKELKINLSDYYSTPDTFLSNATKISLSPGSLYKIQDEKYDVTLKWPDINSDNILFVKTEYDHDVAGHDEPPAIAFWLCRYYNHLIEIHIGIEDDKFYIEPGYMYVIQNNKLQLVKQDGIKYNSKNIKLRISIIEPFLKIHGLIQLDEMALLPNPFDINNWYILI